METTECNPMSLQSGNYATARLSFIEEKLMGDRVVQQERNPVNGLAARKPGQVYATKVVPSSLPQFCATALVVSRRQTMSSQCGSGNFPTDASKTPEHTSAYLPAGLNFSVERSARPPFDAKRPLVSRASRAHLRSVDVLSRCNINAHDEQSSDAHH